MGEVWLAQKEGLAKPFVIKLLLPKLCAIPSHRRRFLREAKIVAELPEGNIVPVVDYGEAEGGRLFLVMPYIDGVNLQTFNEAVLARGGRLPFVVVAHILAEVLEALRDAHTHVVADRLRPVIHRDIKPSNVLISSRGRVFLTDFGIALYDNDYSLETFGTLGYMAPEQARGGQWPQPRIDIFGVGGLAHFMLTGQAPRSVHNLVELHQSLDLPPPPTGRDHVPHPLETLRVSALDPSCATRAATAGDCLSLIEGWEGYRRAVTPIAELYQRLIANIRSGTTEMLAQAQAEFEDGCGPVPDTITARTPEASPPRRWTVPAERVAKPEASESPAGGGAPSRRDSDGELASSPVPESMRETEPSAESPVAPQRHDDEPGDDEQREDVWAPWWGPDAIEPEPAATIPHVEPPSKRDGEIDLDGITIEFRPRRLDLIPPLRLDRVPEEFIPRPVGEIDPDAPRVRRRPRGTVLHSSVEPSPGYVDLTQRLPPTLDRDTTGQGTGHDEGSR